ncbi:hypothetical protein Xkoz_01789 [Xenorhabdus kozodoii]|uniref:Uncharacterized protein n=1 Tax=Xenorhabdus kozodoii TaxID=351676 RepID=A0A2D0LD73_9GAMM|nr:hypothetical protein Xkoz_01789 [Xenorhabdus kozodoii]
MAAYYVLQWLLFLNNATVSRDEMPPLKGGIFVSKNGLLGQLRFPVYWR